MHFGIYFVTPRQGLSIEVRKAAVLDSNHEIVPDKLDGSLHLALGLSPVWATEDGLVTVESGEVLELPVQCGILLFQQPFDDHLLHIVVQYLLRVTAKVPECVLMAAYEGVSGHVCDKFDVPRLGIPQYHEKAIQLFPPPVLVHRVVLEKAPVHLPLLARHRLKPHRCFLVQLLLFPSHIFPHDAVAPVQPLLPDLFQDPFRGVRRFLQPDRDLFLVRIQL